MKKTFTDAIDCIKGIQISKHYDSETKLICPCSSGEPFSMKLKGDFSLNAMQILAVCAASAAMCITFSVMKKLKKC